jgi:hypothetical protein
MIVISGCKTSRAATILLRGANDYMLDEMDRSLHDSLCVVKRVLESGAVVPGKQELSHSPTHWLLRTGILCLVMSATTIATASSPGLCIFQFLLDPHELSLALQHLTT